MSKTKKVTTTTTTVVTEETTTTLKTDKARLIFVLDRSGSMGGIQTEAIGGFNAFVEGQLKQPGKANMSLVIFDHEIDTVHDRVDLKEVPTLTSEVYVPRGMTALYDAIGVTITKYLGIKSDEKTILAILTDGEENSSKEYTGKAIAELIAKAEKEHNWEVLFLGANIDVNKLATQLNIQSNKFATFAASGKGIGDTYSALNDITSTYRSFSSKGLVPSSAQANLETSLKAATEASQ